MILLSALAHSATTFLTAYYLLPTQQSHVTPSTLVYKHNPGNPTYLALYTDGAHFPSGPLPRAPGQTLTQSPASVPPPASRHLNLTHSPATLPFLLQPHQQHNSSGSPYWHEVPTVLTLFWNIVLELRTSLSLHGQPRLHLMLQG